MASSSATVPTESGSKYLQQLCKHWSHKLTVEFTAEKGTVTFPNAVATMTAQPDSLLVTIEAEDAETVERMKGVVANHLDRFAFREAPLPFDWT
ncbi:DUF2218 domain-containing protein [Sphingobium algorifonticola]|uniref:DUF2218 domain-containing protein n=1 Tax=Sphingobium algorifonticola TaxID=2008318 RepID=A0A437JC88_9SPHN|nr:DUF2218 domain-containing protein [Sphingobium algorifonticola]RVT43242.1 DUF2218 domain-containing protein [Sphingobium algorifonticola]